MRTAFAKTIQGLANDRNLMLVTGDLGFGVFEGFEAEHPKRFLNAGITEQSMTSLAAGLADEGFIPIIYSIANFPTMRNFEQIRNDIAYPSRHVVITSVGAGLSYASLGTSHFGIEDMAVLHALPNMTILSPSDPIRAALATEEALSSGGPTYLRLGKNGEPVIGRSDQNQFMRVRPLLNEGSSTAVISIGGIGQQVLKAASMCSHRIDVHSVEQVWPLPNELLELVKGYSNVGFVEEHAEHGGLFTMFIEEWAKIGRQHNFRHWFVDRSRLKRSGSHTYMLQQTGLDEVSLAADFDLWISG